MFRLLSFSFGIIFFGPICASVANSKGHNGFGGYVLRSLMSTAATVCPTCTRDMPLRGTPEYLELVAQSEAR